MALAAFFHLVFNFGQQRFAISNGELVVIGVDFREREEAVTVPAIVHKRRLQRRFDPRHPRQIDVGFNRSAVCRFVVDLLDPTIDHNHNPGFITAGSVDKHFLAHHIS